MCPKHSKKCTFFPEINGNHKKTMKPLKFIISTVLYAILPASQWLSPVFLFMFHWFVMGFSWNFIAFHWKFQCEPMKINENDQKSMKTGSRPRAGLFEFFLFSCNHPKFVLGIKYLISKSPNHPFCMRSVAFNSCSLFVYSNRPLAPLRVSFSIFCLTRFTFVYNRGVHGLPFQFGSAYS